MAEASSRKIFVNLAVRNLKKSMEFFSALGFEFNPKFTDENAACIGHHWEPLWMDPKAAQ